MLIIVELNVGCTEVIGASVGMEVIGAALTGDKVAVEAVEIG
jgi:hypothetical protein